MLHTVDQICQILSAGGNLTLDATQWTVPQLMRIVTAAGAAGTNVTLKNVASVTPSKLADLAQAAPHLVTFDLA